MELLVVIAVVALLAGLLLPALSSARAKASQAACISNLRQLGAGILLYAGDWGGTLPSPTIDFGQAGCWFYAIDPYLLGTTVGATPSTTQKVALIKQDPVWQKLDANARINWRTIKMNRKLVGNRSQGTSVPISAAIPSYRRLVTVAKPANTPLLFDGRCEESNSSVDKQRYDGWEPYVARRHAGQANVLFVDGRAESRKETAQSGGTGWQTDGTTLDWWVE